MYPYNHNTIACKRTLPLSHLREYRCVDWLRSGNFIKTLNLQYSGSSWVSAIRQKFAIYIGKTEDSIAFFLFLVMLISITDLYELNEAMYLLLFPDIYFDNFSTTTLVSSANTWPLLFQIATIPLKSSSSTPLKHLHSQLSSTTTKLFTGIQYLTPW